MDNFYVIKVINRDGTRGYICDMPEGIMVVDGFDIRVRQFVSYQDAQKFIRENKIERRGTKAYIRDNDDIIKEHGNSGEISKIDRTIFYLEDTFGRKCFYDTKESGYYFESREHGYCCWYAKEEINDFINRMNFGFEVVIKFHEPKP